MFNNITLLVYILRDLLFPQIGESEKTADKLLSHVKNIMILFLSFFDSQLIESVSSRAIDNLKIVKLILQAKQYLASQVSTTSYILVIYHYFRMYKINLSNQFNFLNILLINLFINKLDQTDIVGVASIMC